MLIFAIYHNFVLAIINKNFFTINENFYYAIIFIFFILVIAKNKLSFHLLKKYFFITLIIIILFVFSYFQKDISVQLFVFIFVIYLTLFNSNFIINKLDKFLFINTIIIFLFAVIEMFFGSFYYSIVDANQYYINTRSWYNTDAQINYYLGVDRIQGNILMNSINYRISSIFLEPLSLAYYSILVLIIFRYFYKQNTKFIYKIVFNFLILFLIVISDTRSALILYLILLLPDKIFTFKFFNIYIFIIFILIAYFNDQFLINNELIYRLSFSKIIDVNILQLLNLDSFLQSSTDSGFITIFSNFGIFGFFILLYLLFDIDRKHITKDIKIHIASNQIIFYFLFFSLFGQISFSIKTFFLVIYFINYLYLFQKN